MTTKISRSNGRSYSAASLLFTALHLFCYWLLGLMVFTFLLILFSLSLGLALLGIGLAIFALLTTLMLAVARFERARAAALYGLTIPPINEVRANAAADTTGSRSTLLDYLWAKLRQFVEPRMWLALSSFLLTTLIGILMVASLQCAVFFSALAVKEFDAAAGFSSAAIINTLFALVMFCLVPALVYFSAWVTTKLFTTPSRASLTAEIASSKQQRSGAVRAANVERTRLERDLHDGVQPRLVSIGMSLGQAKQKLASDPQAANELINEAHDSVKTAITELRQLARGIHAAVLTDRGLDAALSALAANSHLSVRLNTQLSALQSVPPERRIELETTVYFIVAEALTNVAKHANSTSCSVDVAVVRTASGSALVATVIDNGKGGAKYNPGGGIDGISQRAIAAGGVAKLTSPAGGPTVLEVRIPCES